MFAGSPARDHAAPESAVALVKATGLACGRRQPPAWCSRPGNRATLPAKPLVGRCGGGLLLELRPDLGELRCDRRIEMGAGLLAELAERDLDGERLAVRLVVRHRI